MGQACGLLLGPVSRLQPPPPELVCSTPSPDQWLGAPPRCGLPRTSKQRESKEQSTGRPQAHGLPSRSGV